MKVALALSCLTCLFVVPFATAQSRSDSFAGAREHRAERRAFKLGVCVGQNLAAAGVDVQTDLASPTEETKTALKSAFAACRKAPSAGVVATGTGGATTGGATAGGANSTAGAAGDPAASAGDGTSAAGAEATSPN